MSDGFVVKIGGEPSPTSTSDFKIFVSRRELRDILADYQLKPGYTFEEVFPEFGDEEEKIFIDRRFLGGKLSYFNTDTLGGVDDIYLELNTENKTIIGAINEVHAEIDETVPRVDELEFNVYKIMEEGFLLPDIIDVDQVKANAITADKIMAGSITTDKIKADSIIAEQIKANQIKTEHLQANSITADKIQANSINAGHIQAGSIDADAIQAGVITTTHLSANSVTAEQILAGSITAEKIMAGSINAEHIGANQIDAVHINAGAITTDKILAENIIAEHIAAEQIETQHLKADSINADKIQANAITSAKIEAGAILADKIAANQIEAKHIQANAITADKIMAGSINTSHLQANIINAEHIQAGSITAGSGIIANGAIGNAQISNLSATKLDAGTIDTSKIKIKSQDAVMELYGNQIMVNDTTDALNPQNRVILGEYNIGDGTTDYGLLVRGADGETIMIDSGGVHNAGITDGAIDNNKVADDANISGLKLDIDSVIRTVNENGTETIAGTKVQVGDRTLDIELSTQNQLITENITQISNQQSQINALDDKISLKVSSEEYEEYKGDVAGQLEDLGNSLPYNVYIIPSNGETFVNGDIDTYLMVKVTKGSDDITDLINDHQIVWTRQSVDSAGDAIWDSEHIGVGKEIHITSDDLYKRATFKADVIDIPENRIYYK